MKIKIEISDEFKMEDFIRSICNEFTEDYYNYRIKSYKTEFSKGKYKTTIIAVDQRHYYKTEKVEIEFLQPEEFIKQFADKFKYSNVDIVSAILADYGGAINHNKLKISFT